MLEGLGDGQLQHIGDVLAAIADFERLGVVAPPAALLASHPDIGQEMHLDQPLAVALAGLAAAAWPVEAEAVGRVAADLGLWHPGEQLADLVEDPGVGGRVAGRRVADGRLVDVNHFVDVLDPAKLVVAAGLGGRPVQALGQGGVEHVVDQRALATAGDSGDHDEAAQREGHVDVAEIVVPGPDDL